MGRYGPSALPGYVMARAGVLRARYGCGVTVKAVTNLPNPWEQDADRKMYLMGTLLLPWITSNTVPLMSGAS